MDQNTKTALWVIGIVLGVVVIAGITSSGSNNNSKTTTTSFSKTTYVAPKAEAKTQSTTITWHCVDATSYNKNPYDDNRCTSSTGEVRYVSDSQARALDSSYTPGTSGHPYYNSK